MGSLALLLVIVGAFLIYEVAKNASNASASASTDTTGTQQPASTAIPSSAGLQNEAQWTSLLGGAGIVGDAQQKFLGIINRESKGLSNAVCYAPGSDASQCTPYPKPGDTQGAFGPFQFLNSTWNGYGCTPAAPSNPLGYNYAALNPIYAVECAAKAFKANGFKDWGG